MVLLQLKIGSYYVTPSVSNVIQMNGTKTKLMFLKAITIQVIFSRDGNRIASKTFRYICYVD